MGKCSKCGEKIRYNAFKKLKGVIYCLKCAPEDRISTKLAETVNSAKLDFDELRSAMEEPVKIIEGQTVEELKEEITEQLAKPRKKRSKKRSKKVNK